MHPRQITAAFSALVLAAAAGTAGSAPHPFNPPAAYITPQDRPYPGLIRLAVDATDIERHIVHVHETLSGVTPDTVLLYPEWLPGDHAPEGTIALFAGLRVTAAGRPVAWTRDPGSMFAFHLQLPAGTHTLEIDFEFLSPTTPKTGYVQISRELLILQWNELVLYPSGYFASRIPCETEVTLPEGWRFATALEAAAPAGAGAGAGAAAAHVAFRRTDLDTLVDSPLYAGRHVEVLDLAPQAATPVRLDLFADRTESLAIKPEQLAAFRALLDQSFKLFGTAHFAHYDFLVPLSDQVYEYGLEHAQSSEDTLDPETLTAWDRTAASRDLLAHELTHSWNGKFRRPADLWVPNFSVPMHNTLLWVYEGQTQYWGEVLTVRAGLWNRPFGLEAFASNAAYYSRQAGRRWRALQDTTNDEIINARAPLPWTDYQRMEDYYSEGALLWLDADTLIRERSGGKRSLDDFARAFFGGAAGGGVTVTYTFDDVIRALNAVEPYDWARFWRERLDGVARPAPLDGIERGGYRLVFNDTENEYQKANQQQNKYLDLRYSLGLTIDDKNGAIRRVAWESPAFQAKLTEGTEILAVNGLAYGSDVLKDAITAARKTTTPIELIVRSNDRYRVVTIDYHEGLRYPHLERSGEGPALLDAILATRP